MAMKKFLFIAIALSFLLVSCGKKEERLTLMVGGAADELAYWDTVVEEFEKAESIDVEIIRQAADTGQRKQGIIAALRGKKPDPDVMMLDVGWIGQIASSGWLEPLDGNDIDIKAFFMSIIYLADTYDGKLIALPVYVDGGMLYYRTDLLEKYGYAAPPKTWDELVKMAKKVQAGERKNNPDFWGYVWQGAQYEGLVCDALEVFTSAGGTILGSDGKSAINSKENIKALQVMVDFVQKDKISPPNTFTDMKEEEVRIMFQNGNALFERNWPYAWGSHKSADSVIKDKFSTGPLPHFEGYRSASTLGGWHIAVSKFSDQKEKAIELTKYLTSYEIQKKFVLKLGWNPSRLDVYQDEDIIKKNPNLDNLRRIFIGAVPRPTVPYYSQISVILQKYINAAISGKSTPKEALDKAHKEMDEVIVEYGG
jgi:multiple sugar transport system substrate-binding protein